MVLRKLTNQHVICYVSAIALGTLVLVATHRADLATIPPFAMWMLINRRRP